MKATTDLASGLFFLSLGVGAIFLARSFGPGAAMFPTIVAALMVMFASVLILRALTGRGRVPSAPVITEGKRFAIMLGATLVYIVLLPEVGFFTSSALFVPITAAALGFRRPVYLAVTTLIFIVLLYALFVVLLKRPLPPEFFLAF